jgi:50S ribosomal subunit-associated GTPase HflX
MTDNEIIKALEEWRKELVSDYQRLKLLDAPMDCFEESHGDTITNLTNALDLINRQKAEVLRLQNKVEILEMEKQMSKEDSDKSKAAAMGVIKRQDAEIERLNKAIDNYETCLEKIETIKAEAVKEFAERLKEKERPAFPLAMVIDVYEIDNLVKEMVGEG